MRHELMRLRDGLERVLAADVPPPADPFQGLVNATAKAAVDGGDLPGIEPLLDYADAQERIDLARQVRDEAAQDLRRQLAELQPGKPTAHANPAELEISR